MIVRLAHVCLRTSRFNEMTEFYRDIIGLPIKFSLKLPDGRIFGHYFDLGETSFLELFDQKGSTEMWGGKNIPPQNPEGNTFHHICLQVTGLEELRNRIIAKGIPARETERGIDNSYQSWVKDPDGNDVELMEYTNESLQLAK